MASFWGMVVLLCGMVVISGAQKTKSNMPRLKLSYKGESYSFTLTLTVPYFFPLSTITLKLSEKKNHLCLLCSYQLLYIHTCLYAYPAGIEVSAGACVCLC
jgi:hypothetical protein